MAVQPLREQCRREGREVLTPLAATLVFGISNAAVRAARLAGKVRHELTISVMARDVHLIDLDSALRYWRLPEQMLDTLARMRREATIISVEAGFYNVLHPDGVVKPFRPAPPADASPATAPPPRRR